MAQEILREQTPKNLYLVRCAFGTLSLSLSFSLSISFSSDALSTTSYHKGKAVPELLVNCVPADTIFCKQCTAPAEVDDTIKYDIVSTAPRLNTGCGWGPPISTSRPLSRRRCPSTKVEHL